MFNLALKAKGFFMKKNLLSLLLFWFSLNAYSNVEVQLVKDIKDATIKKLWKGVPLYGVPNKMIEKVLINIPQSSFEAPYENIFYQNSKMILCFIDCESEQLIRLVELENERRNFSSFITLSASELFSGMYRMKLDGLKKKVKFKIIKQNTVYYWVNKMFDRLADLDFYPKNFLEVFVDKKISKLTMKSEMRNNAFYSPYTKSLNFLSHKNTLLTRLMGMKLRPTALDPSVAIHEAAHFVFDELTGGGNVNMEISGVNEGFADYIAMTILNTDKMGTIMFSGKIMRDASKLLEYKKKMEVHNLGNVVASLLLNIRSSVEDKDIFDKIVLQSVRDLGNNLYATAFDFTRILIENMRGEEIAINTIDESIKKIKISKLSGSFKKLPKEIEKYEIKQVNKLEISVSGHLPPLLLQQYGIEKELLMSRVSSLNEVDISSLDEFKGDNSKRKAKFVEAYRLVEVGLNHNNEIIPFWLFFESTSNNLLSAYDKSFNKITDKASMSLVFNAFNLFKTIDEFRKVKEVETLLLGMSLVQKVIFKLKKQSSEEVYIRFNEELIPVTRNYTKIKLTYIGYAISLLFSDILGIDEIITYTSTNKKFKGRLPKIGKKRFLLGYNMRWKSGYVSKLMITSLGDEIIPLSSMTN